MSVHPDPQNSGSPYQPSPGYPPPAGNPLPPVAVAGQRVPPGKQPPTTPERHWWPIVRANLIGPIIGTFAFGMVIVLGARGNTPIRSVLAATGSPFGSFAVPTAAIGILTSISMSLLLDFPIFVLAHFIMARLFGGRGSFYSLCDVLTRYQVPILADIVIYLLIVPSDLGHYRIVSMSTGLAAVLLAVFNVCSFVLGAITYLVLPIPGLRVSQRFRVFRAILSALLAFGIYWLVVTPITYVLTFAFLELEIAVMGWILGVNLLVPH